MEFWVLGWIEGDNIQERMRREGPENKMCLPAVGSLLGASFSVICTDRTCLLLAVGCSGLFGITPGTQVGYLAAIDGYLRKTGF